MFIVDLRLRRGVTHDAAEAAQQPLLDQFSRDMFVTPTADKKKVLKPTCLGSR